MTMIKEHDRVILAATVLSEGLVEGDVGTVVRVYRDGQTYEVEFTTLEGQTAAWSRWKLPRYVQWGNARSRTLANWLHNNSLYPSTSLPQTLEDKK